MMRALVTAFASLIFATFLGAAANGAATPLRIGGLPAHFALWDPQSPSYDYKGLQIGTDRIAALRGEGWDIVERLYHSTVRLLENGDVEETVVRVRFYLTEEGVRDHGDSFHWVDSFSEQASVVEAYTLLPSENRIEVDPATIQLITDTSEDIFTDSIQLVVPFPRLQPLTASVLVIRSVRSAQKWPLPWSSNYFTQSNQPIEELRVQVTWDETRTPPVWKSNAAGLTCDSSRPRTLNCLATRIPPYATDPDVNYWDIVPTLLVAEPATWQALADQVGALSQGAIEGNADVRSLSAELTAGKDSEKERLDAVHRFVSQEIRYVGLEQGLGGIVARPTSLTLQRRYGDCKDKTMLFVELARTAGLDAYPVLTSINRYDRERLLLPAASYFNHMVACVRLQDGEEFCVDLTDPYSQADHFPSNGAIRLDLRAGIDGPGEFPSEAFLRSLKVTTTTRIQHDGSLEEEQVRYYSQVYAARTRAFFQSMDQNQRKEWALTQYNENVSGLTRPRFEFEGLSDVGRPMVVRSWASYEPLIGNSQTEYVEWEPWLNYHVQHSKSDNQHYDYDFGGLFLEAESTYVVEGDRSIGRRGPNVHFESTYGEFRRYYEKSNQTLKIVSIINLPRQVIALEQLEEFNAFMQSIKEHAKLRFELLGVDG